MTLKGHADHRFWPTVRAAASAKGPLVAVAIHTAAVLLLVALHPWLVPGSPYDDVYPCFLCVSGPVYVWAARVSQWMAPLVERHAPFMHVGRAVVVYLPALFCTIFGAVQWYLIAVVVGTIRRLVRPSLTVGRCPACGYDLRATPGRCPECGTIAAR